MSWWTDFRDTVQSIGSVVLNYYYPGLGTVANMLHSKGSQEQMGTTLGQLALFGSGMAGGYNGNMANYGNTLNAMSGGATVGAVGDAAGYGVTGTGTIAGQQEAAQTYMSLLQQGYPTEVAVQASGLNPSYAASAGVPTGSSGVTWADIAASPQFSGQQGMAGANGTPAGAGSGAPGTFGGGTTPGASTAAASTGVMPWGSPGNVSTIGSGIYGMSEAMRMRQLAEQAGQQADPFGPFRRQYADQMAALSADPSLITKQPGYEAGLQAIKRTMASQGYTGSGNMMAALAKYGGDFYNQTMNQYAGLAGAGFNPAAGAQIGLQGQQYGVDLAGRALGSIGYGMRAAGGWPGQGG